MKTIDSGILRKTIKKRPAEAHKYDFGQVLCIGGEEKMGGAIILAASACVYSGAGITRVACHSKHHPALLARTPEAMVLDWADEEEVVKQVDRADLVLIGPGLGRSGRAKEILGLVLGRQRPDQVVLVDGDAIPLFKQVGRPLVGPAIFTPHTGEWQALTGLTPDQENPQANLQVQKDLQASIILKKHRTEVYHQGQVWKNTIGCPAQAIGGSGDVLAGMVASFVVQFGYSAQSLAAAVYAHSAIAEELAQKDYVALPSRLVQQIPTFMKAQQEQ